MRTMTLRRWSVPTAAFFALVLVCVTAFLTSPARADDVETYVPRFDVTAHLGDDGTLSVRFDITAEFSEDAHGLFFVLPTAQRYEDDSHDYQLFDVDFGEARMDGNPVPAIRFDEDDTATLRVGDEDTYVSGRHDYSVEFTVQGLVRPGDPGSGTDILPWDVITAGAYEGWDIGAFSLHLTAPDGGSFTCTAGEEGSSAPCAGISQLGGEYSAVVSHLGEGGVTAKLTWDGGTVRAPEPTIEYREPVSAKYGFNWAVLGAGVVLVGAAIAAAFGLARKDERYVGLAPGVYPDRRQDAVIGLSSKHPKVVRFERPEMLAAQAGVALKKKIDDGDVLATVIVSLAQRGYLQIVEYDDPLGKKQGAPNTNNWMLYVIREPDGNLAEWEAEFLAAVADPSTGEDAGMKKKEALDVASWQASLQEAGFAVPERPGTRLRQLRDSVAQKAIADATADAAEGWLLPAGRSQTANWMRHVSLAGGVIGVLMIAAGFLGDIPIVGYGIALTIASVIVRLGCVKTVAFSADGSVAHEQAAGYRLYLEKAEVGQLREAERAQLFVDTLPWAISLGVVDHWGKIADEVLQVQPGIVWAPFWFSTIHGYGSPSTVSGSVNDFSEAAGTAAHMAGASQAYKDAANTVSSSSSGSSGSVGGGSFGSGGGTW
ncbi:DUF2207 domain-containing protein [Actinomycetaceae bacterium L2_0104]